MARTREIKKRMVAVRNIQRITKTMQMIATAKFTSALQRAKASQPYAKRIREMVADVASAAGDVENPLLKAPAEPKKKELLLVITSDRGLAGAYNGNVLRGALNHIRGLRGRGSQVVVETSGKKANAFFRFAAIPVSQRHTIGDKPKYEEVRRLAERYIESFAAGEYDAVRVAYMRFISNARQVAEVMQLLPLATPDAPAPAASSPSSREPAKQTAVEANYEFSPGSEALLAELLPESVKVSLFQAFNDSVVSEQVMRMVAMKAATDNAKGLGKTLKRKFNRARQTQITTELMEVIAGAAALE
jgi:F-type H+-transporting ATPase subunit gamma